MKHRLPHLIAKLLACLMLLSSVSILAGCAKEDDPATETASGQNGTAGETSTEYVPDIAKKNYNTLSMLSPSDSTRTSLSSTRTRSGMATA